MKCQSLFCKRQPEPGYAVCSACLRVLLRGAFGTPEVQPEPQSWHDRARARAGRTDVVGGIAA